MAPLLPLCGPWFELRRLDEWIRRKLRCYRLKEPIAASRWPGSSGNSACPPISLPELALRGKVGGVYPTLPQSRKRCRTNGSCTRESFLWSSSMRRYDMEETAVYDKYRTDGCVGGRGREAPPTRFKACFRSLSGFQIRSHAPTPARVRYSRAEIWRITHFTFGP